MLQCLDENKPVEAISFKDAVFMMAKAWDDVSITTSRNWLNKEGFPDDVANPLLIRLIQMRKKKQMNLMEAYAEALPIIVPLLQRYHSVTLYL